MGVGTCAGTGTRRVGVRSQPWALVVPKAGRGGSSSVAWCPTCRMGSVKRRVREAV